jgi:4-hydroxy-3-polyprenylbenzoate decarboxylase
MEKDITSFRSTLKYLDERGELLRIKKEISPDCEVAGVIKALDSSLPILFENVKGYNIPIAASIENNLDRFASLFNTTPHEFYLKALEATKNPIPYKIVDDGPCKENVIRNINDIRDILPIIKHSPEDAGFVVGGSQQLVMLPDGGTHLSNNRTHFYGGNWGSQSNMGQGVHLEAVFLKVAEKRGKFPLTMNIGCSPAIISCASAGNMPQLWPLGTDEVGIAGALQGAPVELVKAHTVDAYAIANAEIVIEGYVDTSETVYENPIAKSQEDVGMLYFFPEFTGYLGMAYKTYKFQATCITYRNNPYYYVQMGDSFAYDVSQYPFTVAAVYDACNKVRPGLIDAVHIIQPFRGKNGIILRIKKRRRRDEGFQANMIQAAFVASPYTRLVIVVDEDVDIYNIGDVMWAINSRLDASGIYIFSGRGNATAPIGRSAALEQTGRIANIGLDCTVPFSAKYRFRRANHLRVDLKRWLGEEDIKRARSMQSEYARCIAEHGW